MNMRLPDSGSFVGSVLGGLGQEATDGHDVSVATVSETQLGEAIEAMIRGDLEYIVLEDGDEFGQAAGDGDGPYAVQFSAASGAELEELRADTDAATMRALLLAYRRGDAGWRELRFDVLDRD